MSFTTNQLLEICDTASSIAGAAGDLLREAYDPQGKCKPVLAVGRDGISVCRQPHGFWEVASVATITVYDRSGKRLGTVYLAQMPQLGQGKLTEQLTRLIRDILRAWEPPMPRLCYVTDAGENETQFYRKVLRNLRDPRCPRRRGDDAAPSPHPDRPTRRARPPP